jgi:glutamate/tyrosine decarboxylase-like PLP-dependent enzyme
LENQFGKNTPTSFADSYRDVLAEAARLAQHYLDDLLHRSVGVSPEAIDRLKELGGPLPTTGEEPTSILHLLHNVGAPATVASMGGRFFGGVIGGALPVSVGAHWMADAWDQNACLYDMSPVAAYLEDVVLRWLLSLFGLPADCGGAFVTGTQMADVTALASARTALLSRQGWDVERDGLFGAPPINVIVGEEVHATMLKALALVGLGRGRVHFVDADSQGRMNPKKIPFLQGPTIICAQAGNVNTGSFDPIAAVCDAAVEMNAWVHVDGAFGLWAATSQARRHLVEGIERADSWATDAHKCLNVPHDSGFAMVRDTDALRRAMSITAAYYPPNPGSRRQPMQIGPDSSRRARAVEIWAALRALGSNGVADLVERTSGHAKRFAESLEAAGFTVLNEVVFNQALISFGDDHVTDRIVNAIQAEGTCWCGGTTWKGRRAMRVSVSSWATTDADIERSLEAIVRIARAQGACHKLEMTMRAENPS